MSEAAAVPLVPPSNLVVKEDLQALLQNHIDAPNPGSVLSEGFMTTLEAFKMHQKLIPPQTVRAESSASAAPMNPPITAKRSFGRRDAARKPIQSAAVVSEAQTSAVGSSGLARLHWVAKSRDTMTHLDWVHLKESFSICIAAKNTPRATLALNGDSSTARNTGARPALLASNTAPHPLRCWGELKTLCPSFPLWLLSALGEKFPFPSSIQMQSVAAAIAQQQKRQGEDVMAIAETGSGKTLAYVVSAFAHLATNDFLVPFDMESARKGPRVLILVPNRELGIQVFAVIEALAASGPRAKDGKSSLLKVGVAVGGENADTQHQRISSGLHFLVASPGQAIKLLEQSYLALGNARCVIIDEADTMVDDGLSDQLVETLMQCPCTISAEGSGRQTLLFTATMLPQLEEIASTYLAPSYYLVSTPYRFARTDQRFFLFQTKMGEKAHSPTNTGDAPATSAPVSALEESQTLHREKILKLIALLQLGLEGSIEGAASEAAQPINGPVMVFSNSKRTVEQIERWLSAEGIAAKALHGEMKQDERRSTIESFRRCGVAGASGKNGVIQVLVTTDMLARGLDVPNIELVVNFDLPRPTVSVVGSGTPLATKDLGERGLVRYIHRIGRTARAGKQGSVCSFVTLNPSLLKDTLDDQDGSEDVDSVDSEEEEEDPEGDNQRGKRDRGGDQGKATDGRFKEQSRATKRRREGEMDDRHILKPLLKMLKGCTHPSAKAAIENSQLQEVAKNLSSSGAYVGKALLS